MSNNFDTIPYSGLTDIAATASEAARTITCDVADANFLSLVIKVAKNAGTEISVKILQSAESGIQGHLAVGSIDGATGVVTLINAEYNYSIADSDDEVSAGVYGVSINNMNVRALSQVVIVISVTTGDVDDLISASVVGIS